MNIIRALTTVACLGAAAMAADPAPQPAPAKKSVTAPDEASIKAVVAHFAKHEVKLEHDKNGRWVVADPKGDGYQAVVHLRTFPAAATEKEMRDELRTINLGYMLNVPARVAMSHPYLEVPDATKKTPKLDQLPVVAKLEKLFKEYQPPEPKK